MQSKAIIYIALSMLTFFSCFKKDANDGLPYYQFNDADKSKLLVSYEAGKELIYKNQYNEKIKFKIINSLISKSLYAIGTFWGTYLDKKFYYDEQHIIMCYNEYTWSNCEIVLEKYPVGSNYLLQEPITETPEFIGFLTFPLWNGFNGEDSFSNSIKLDLTMGLSLTINGKVYNKVKVFESGKNQVLRPDNNPSILPRNVNKIYYDENYGVIEFDDLDGKLWRLK
jgi:hypothetical protein